MSTTTTKWQRPLTGDELVRIVAAVESAATPVEALIEGLIGFYSVAVQEAEGRSWAEFQADPDAKLVPWQYAIPEGQWGAIATAITERSRRVDPLGAANYLLDWMNKGPSAYDPEAVS